MGSNAVTVLALGEAIIRQVMVEAVAGNADRRSVRSAEPRRGFGQRIEHGLQIERRAADHLEHVGGGGLLLQDRIVVRSSLSSRVFSIAITAWAAKFCHQLDLLVGEGAHLLAVDRDGADQTRCP